MDGTYCQRNTLDTASGQCQFGFMHREKKGENRTHDRLIGRLSDVSGKRGADWHRVMFTNKSLERFQLFNLSWNRSNTLNVN